MRLGVSEPEDITGIPAFAQGFMDGMRQAVRQRWYEAAMAFFSRAIINRAVSVECQVAGFNEARYHFEQRAHYFIAEGFRCLSNAGKAVAHKQ